MFQRLENIFNAIKGFFGFFESVLSFIVKGFSIMVLALNFVFQFYDDRPLRLPRYVAAAAMIVLFVWAVRTITGRLNR